MIDKLLWTNKDINYLLRKNIVEYDMQAASLSVSRRFNLIEPNRLVQLEQMPKEQRTVQVGLMQRDDKEFSEKMIQGVIKTRQDFLDKNHIKESDILCCHSDAVIFEQTNAKIYDTIDNVKFNNKNRWTSYINYNGIEMYYADGCIDYKGIPKNMLHQHTLGLNIYLINIFRMLEDYDPSIIKYIKKFQLRYMQDKLPEHFYLPFIHNTPYKYGNLSLFAFIANIIIGDRHEHKW